MNKYDDILSLRMIPHNKRLVDKRREHGFNQVIFAHYVGIPHTRYGWIETLWRKPTQDEEEVIAEALESSVKYLFPKELYALVDTGKLDIRKISLNTEETVKFLSSGLDSLKYLPDYDKPVLDQELKEQIQVTLKELSDRERRVICQRFGLDGNDPKDLEAVGREFNVTRERIRQIEAKALRKLRHPRCSRKLKDYLE